ncbi:TOBE domain-containing protein [Streptomyces exfoliatus]|uniref:TOBE domain-containing protein n=1 Tax=Streptomyces exfoliatus TaxID=1905 RepID=UPI003C2F3F0F
MRADDAHDGHGAKDDTGLDGPKPPPVARVGCPTPLQFTDGSRALSTADLVAVLREGRVAQCGTPEELYHWPVNPWLASFVGDAVLVPGTADDDVAATALGRIPLAAAPEGLRDGLVLFRPEQLRLSEPDSADAAGVVTDVRFFGHDALVTVAVDGLDRPIDIRTPSPLRVEPGVRVGVCLTGEATLHPRIV